MDRSAPTVRPAGVLQILAAEDSAANRMVLKALLAGFGVDLSFAVDGCEAVEVAGRRSFDLLFMDAHMPRMDGVEALRIIRTGDGPCAGSPIFMLTANAMHDDAHRYREAGADGVLAKPVDIAQLANVIAGLRARAA